MLRLEKELTLEKARKNIRVSNKKMKKEKGINFSETHPSWISLWICNRRHTVTCCAVVSGSTVFTYLTRRIHCTRGAVKWRHLATSINDLQSVISFKRNVDNTNSIKCKVFARSVQWKSRTRPANVSVNSDWPCLHTVIHSFRVSLLSAFKTIWTKII